MVMGGGGGFDVGDLRSEITLGTAAFQEQIDVSIASLRELQAEIAKTEAAARQANVTPQAQASTESVEKSARSAAATQQESEAVSRLTAENTALRDAIAKRADASAAAAQSTNTNAESILRSNAAQEAARRSEQDFFEKIRQTNQARLEQVIQNQNAQQSVEELTAAEKAQVDARNAARAAPGEVGQNPEALAARRAEQVELTNAIQTYSVQGQAIREVTTALDGEGRVYRLVVQNINAEQTAVQASITGYTSLGEKMTVIASAKGTVADATRVAESAAIAEADSLGLVARQAETTSGSLVKLGGSASESGNAHLRLYGPLGVAAAAIALVGAAALDEASKLETARIRTEEYGNTSDVVGKQLQSSLGSSFGTGTHSASQWMEATAPVAGMLKQIEGGTIELNQQREIAAAVDQLQIISGEKLSDTMKAEAVTLREFKLGSADAQTVSASLLDVLKSTGEPLDTIAQKLGMVHSQLGIFNPSLSESAALIKAAAEAGTDGTRALNGITTAIDGLSSGTEKTYQALQKYKIQIQDTNGVHLTTTQIIGELNRAIEGKSDAQAIAILRELGMGDANKTTIDVIRDYPQKLQEVTNATQQQANMAGEAAKQQDTLGASFNHLKATASTALTDLGTVAEPVFKGILGFINDTINGLDALAKDFETGNVKRIIGALALMGSGNPLAALQLIGSVAPGGTQAGSNTQGTQGTTVPGPSGLGRTALGRDYTITQGYGPTDETLEPAYAGYPHFHMGVDYGAPAGTQVSAITAGTIKDIIPSKGEIIEALQNGQQVIYEHLQPEQIAVKVGQAVTEGMRLGQVGAGSIGASTGPHLHLEIDDASGKPIDPANLILGNVTRSIATLPPEWMGALQKSESKFSLPTPDKPQPMFGLMGVGPAGTKQFSSEGGGIPGSSMLFNTPDEGINALMATVEKIVPNWRDYVARGDTQGFFSALAPKYFASGSSIQDQGWAKVVSSLVGQAPPISPATPPSVANPFAGGLGSPNIAPGVTATPSPPPSPLNYQNSPPAPGGADPYGSRPQATPSDIDSATTAVQNSQAAIIRGDDLLAASSRTVTQATVDQEKALSDAAQKAVSDYAPKLAAAAKKVDDLKNQPNVSQGDLAAATHDLGVAQNEYNHLVDEASRLTTRYNTDQSALTSNTQQVAEARRHLNDATTAANEQLTKGSQIVTQQTLDDDQRRVQSARQVVIDRQKDAQDAEAALESAQAQGNPADIKTAQDASTLATQNLTDATNELGKAMTQLTDDTDHYNTNIKNLSDAWVSYDEVTRRVTEQSDQRNKVVTLATLAYDDQKVASARDAAYQQGNIVYNLMEEMQFLTDNGTEAQIDAIKKEVDAAQKLYGDYASAFIKANDQKKADLKQFDDTYKTSIQAQGDLLKEQMAQNQQIFTQAQAGGLNVPTEWKQMLGTSGGLVQSLSGQIQEAQGVLANAGQLNMSPEAITSMQEHVQVLQQSKQQAQDIDNAVLSAAKLRDQGETESQKASLDRIKALREEDLSNVQEKNRQKLQSDLDRIQQSTQAEVDSFNTSAQVAQIQAQTYEAQAGAATNIYDRQKLQLQASLAEQTASIEQNEAQQLQAIRAGEEQKLQEYNARLLEYQEAQQKSNGMQLELQADLDQSKANMDIALAELQIQLQKDVNDKVKIEDDDYIQSLQTYISTTLPAYNKSIRDNQIAWADWGTTVGQGLLKAQNAVTGLTQYSDQQAQHLQASTQNQLSLLQAQSQAQSSMLDLAKQDPQTQALQRQVDQLTVVKQQQDLALLPEQQRLQALQSQNAVMQAQIQLIEDTQHASQQYLAMQTQQKQLNVEKDQADLALLQAITEQQRASLAAVTEQIAVLQSKTAVLDAQATLMNDQAKSSQTYLDLQTQIKDATLTQAQNQLALLQAVSEAQQSRLASEKESLTVAQSQSAVTDAQLRLAQDQAALKQATSGASLQLQELAVSRATVELDIQEQTNGVLQQQLAAEQAITQQHQNQLNVLEAQLRLIQDTQKIAPQYQSLQVNINQLQIQQDALATAGRHNATIDRITQLYQSQLQLMDAQNTLANTGLQQQIDTQKVNQDRLTLTQTQTQAQIDVNAQLQSQLAMLNAQIGLLQAQQTLTQAQVALQTTGLQQQQLAQRVSQDQLNVQIAQDSVVNSTQSHLALQASTLDRQLAVLQAQDKVQTSQAAVNQDILSRQQAQQKVQEDQLKLQQAQQSVITDTVAQLTLQVQAYDRQGQLLQAQSKLLTDQNTLANDQLTQQQAVAKVQTDQLTVEQAQVKAQQDMVGGVNATLAVLQQELGLRQSILKVQQTVVPTTTPGGGGFGGSQPGSGFGGSQFGGNVPSPHPGGGGSQVGATPTGLQGMPGYTPPSNVANMPLGSNTLNPIWNPPIPSTVYSPSGAFINSGPLSGYTIVNHINVNIGSKTITEYILQNLATGQVLDVAVP